MKLSLAVEGAPVDLASIEAHSICVSHTLRLESLSDTAMSDSEMSRMSAEQDEVDSRVPMNEKWKR